MSLSSRLPNWQPSLQNRWAPFYRSTPPFWWWSLRQSFGGCGSSQQPVWGNCWGCPQRDISFPVRRGSAWCWYTSCAWSKIFTLAPWFWWQDRFWNVCPWIHADYWAFWKQLSIHSIGSSFWKASLRSTFSAFRLCFTGITPRSTGSLTVIWGLICRACLELGFRGISCCLRFSFPAILPGLRLPRWVDSRWGKCGRWFWCIGKWQR